MTATLERGLSPLRAVLPNGIGLLAQENRAIPVVAINATFDAGSINDPDELPGVAYLAAKSIDRGTATRSADEIADLLDERGVSLRASVTRHTFTLACVCLADDFADVLALVTEIARHASFPGEQVDKRRIKAITSVRQDEDSTSSRASALMHRAMYGAAHPYGRPRKGSVASLERITRADLVRFQSDRLVSGGLRLAVAGAVEPSKAVDLSARLLAGWTPRQPGLQMVVPPPPSPRSLTILPMPGKSQTDIAYGFPTISRLDPRYYAYLAMNTILGQFGLGGRLADNIRERQGMAYYAYSTLDGMLADSPLVIRAGVDPANTARALEAIDLEVRTLGESGATESEFADAIDSLVGAVARALETSESIAEFLQAAEQFGLGTDHDRRLPGLLRAVTLDDVAEAAREVLDPSRAAIAVAGPHDVDADLSSQEPC
jgi:zinc protease